MATVGPIVGRIIHFLKLVFFTVAMTDREEHTCVYVWRARVHVSACARECVRCMFNGGTRAPVGVDSCDGSASWIGRVRGRVRQEIQVEVVRLWMVPSRWTWTYVSVCQRGPILRRRFPQRS